MRASIPLHDLSVKDINEHCVKVKAETPDGTFLSYLEIGVPAASARPTLALRSPRNIAEPALIIHVDFRCGNRIKRTYQALLDPIAPVSAGTASTPIRWANDSSDHSAFDSLVTVAAASGDTLPLPTRPKQLPPIKEPKLATKAIVQDTLKMSLGETPISTELQLTDVLTLGSNNAPATEDLLLARREFAALARDGSLLQSVLLEMDGLQRNLREAEGKLSTLAEQNATKNATIQTFSANHYPAHWIAALGGVLAFSLGTIGWLVVRQRRFKEQPTPWYASSGNADSSATARSRLVEPDAHAVDPNQQGWQEPHFGAGNIATPVDGTMPGAGEATPPAWPEFEDDGNEQDGSDQPAPAKSFNVEEVSDVVQEAEFWMLMNNPQRAIEILEAHAYTDYPDSPITWLYLIELYRTIGDREKYDHLGRQFKKGFNARVPAWEEDPAATANASLTDFPMLMVRIYAVWDNDEKCIAFLQSLLIDDRDGSRIGFDLPVYREIIMLIGIVVERARHGTTPQETIQEEASPDLMPPLDMH